MKSYSTLFEFLIGLLGVIMHTFVVMFIVAYLASPSSLEFMIESTTGSEQAMLTQFLQEINDLSFMVYAGSFILIFEWVAIFRILKHADKNTPLWAVFLILGALYAYFYFGGLEVFILLMLSGVITLVRYYKHKLNTK